MVTTAMRRPLKSRRRPMRRQSPDHPSLWLGTDHLGRDIFSRIIYGSRISLVVSLPAVAISAAIGLALGLLAGFYGGWCEGVMMRLMDLQLAFPFILFALSLVALLGPSLHNIILVFALTT